MDGALGEVHEGEALGRFVQIQCADMGAVSRNFNGNGAGGESTAREVGVVIHTVVVDDAVGIAGVGSGRLHGADHDAVFIYDVFFAHGQGLKQMGILFQIQWLGHDALLCLVWGKQMPA